jgi:hypothetical protein
LTSRCLIALADAHELADRMGDASRETRYREAMRHAARYIMQLQFRPDECYYVGHAADVVHGSRVSAWDNRITADDTAAALLALTRARTRLFGAPPDRRLETNQPGRAAATASAPAAAPR